MTTSDGGVQTDVQTAAANTNDNKNAQNGSDNDIQKQFDELKAQFETLSKESRGKDAKISELLKEKDLKDLSSKTEKEQLEAYKLKVSEFERREAFRTSFKETGLDPDVFMSIVDEKDPKLQAEKFASLLKTHSDTSAKTALEKYKAEELKKIGDKPEIKTKVKTTSPNDTFNQMIRSARGQ